MHIAIKDEHEKVILNYCIDNQAIKNFNNFANCVDDIGEQSEICHNISLHVSLSLKDINQRIKQLSGLSVTKRHIKHALDYFNLDHMDSTISLPELGIYSVAAGVFFSDCWGIKSQKIKTNFSRVVQESNYIPTACNYVIENNIVSAYEPLTMLIESCNYEYRKKLPSLLPLKNLNTLYENLYTSPEFYAMQKKVEQLPKNLTIRDILDKHIFDPWRYSSKCDLFNELTGNSIHKAIADYVNPYTPDLQISYWGNYRYFSHLPLHYVFSNIDSIIKDNKGNVNCIPQNIDNVLLTDIDKHYIKRFPKGSNINFMQCTINKETREYFRSIGYEQKYCMPLEFGKLKTDVKYIIMPNYWRWVKVGSGLLFAGCTIAFCYYIYQQAKKACASTDLFLDARADYIREQLIKNASLDMIDAYKLVHYRTSSFDTQYSRVVSDVLQAIDPKPINDSTVYMVSSKNYDAAHTILRNLWKYWDNYNSHFAIWYPVFLKSAGALLYGTIATFQQVTRFLYGPKPWQFEIPYLFVEDITRALKYQLSIGCLMEPLLLIETLLGMNKPQVTIITDSED
ncbi:MAG TPA: hypothetical protein VGW78_03555 [Candidatus Babeliales bacterium]|jgi:hypothetical protein|nr:hypothetical protein [Candidatus Babeliales bacterium]